jgi:lysophospholipase L1-like esterase
VRFAIVQFRDHTDSLEYVVEQAFTADINLAQLAVARLNVAEGEDNPEAYNLVFNRARNPRLGWRKGSRRLLVVIGDAEPRGAGTAGIPGCRDTSADPRGYNTATELAKLKRARITLLMVLQTSSRSSAAIECYRSLAAGAYSGGGAFAGGSGSDVAAAINRLIDKAIVTYAAIGDSYSSGEGNPPFTGGECHRSEAAWPNILASNARRLSFLGNRACSGATKEALDKPFKGQRPMIDQVAALDPDLVTLTITGNDVGFGSVLSNCFRTDCVWNGRLRKASQAIEAQRKYLPDYLRKLKNAAPDAKIVLVGYPKVFPRTQAEAVNCGWLEPEERQSLNNLGEDLDAIERMAAAQAGVRFVSVLDALAGHELCTRDSWMFRIALSCVGGGGSLCGHPLKPGQEAIANRVQKALGF